MDPAGAPAGEALLITALPVLEDVLAFVTRRGRCRGDEAEEFGSWVRLRLVEQDYDVLRRFDGRSSLRTYLSVVVHRLFIDFRRHVWGVWRHSAEARRLGGTALRLELLLHRDGLALEEAIEVLRTNEGVAAGADELRGIAARLPGRRQRRADDGPPPPEVSVAADEAVEGPALADERAGRVRGLVGALRQAMGALPAEDAVILRLRFVDGFSVPRVAELLALPVKSLYRRIERRLEELRGALRDQGMDAQELAGLLGDPAFDADPPAGESPVSGPSKGREDARGRRLAGHKDGGT